MELQKRNKLIIDNMHLVKIQANKKKKQVPQLEYDELISAGSLGLVRAADGYDESKGFFESYAIKFVSGAMNDSISSILHWGKWMPSNVKVSYIEECDSSTFSYHNNNDKYEGILNLSEQEIVNWYFVDRLTYKQIGRKLGVNKSRVAQKMRNMAEKVKSAL